MGLPICAAPIKYKLLSEEGFESVMCTSPTHYLISYHQTKGWGHLHIAKFTDNRVGITYKNVLGKRIMRQKGKEAHLGRNSYITEVLHGYVRKQHSTDNSRFSNCQSSCLIKRNQFHLQEQDVFALTPHQKTEKMQFLFFFFFLQ